ncbi:MAG: diphosphomevalonate decarboxylase [Candidatus Levybacteria bacterium RIFCSPLOWO2_02_FULL_36_8b]|nr:MAG: diphosphomevalonate decarboxylase [Candidatus Levybacteria bacterium RIFCSPLOWO2_02_FULL_36_8b]
MKATAIAPSNIAFIKYWGRKNEVLRLPSNGSISMNLSNLLTTTTVEFNSSFKEDVIIIDDRKEESEGNRAIKHLDRIRKIAKIDLKARVVTKNNFPTGTGLSSSASGFAALTVAASAAAGLNLSKKELSILARQGSGSACRSIPDGFVEWLDGDTNETSYGISLHTENYWDIVDVVAVVSRNKKEVSTTEGQKLASSSPFFKVRKEKIKAKIKLIKKYLKEKDFTKFGELVEAEALELHAIMLTSSPSLIYLLPGSLRIMHLAKKWRQEGLQVYFTVNTGQDIHLICEKKDVETLAGKLEEIEDVQKTIINYCSKGARIVLAHLF